MQFDEPVDRAASEFDVSLDGHTILVVDDDPACRFALQDCLEEVGAGVYAVGSGAAALEYLELVRPSAVLLDHQMPGMSGLELLERIRGRSALDGIPTVMITANSDPSAVRLAALEAGVDDFLTKPVETLELRLRLRNLLRIQSYRRALEVEKRSLETEVAHRTSQVRHQALVVQSVADAIVSTDPDLRVRTWNPGAEKLYGVRAEVALDRPLFDLVRTAWEVSSQARMLEALARDGRWTGDLTQACEGGRAVHVRASVTRLDGVDGELQGYAFVHHDLTEQTRARQLMRQAEVQSAQAQRLEALGAVTGNLAHDFNNWLGVIMSYTSLVLEDTPKVDQRRQDLEVALEASESASDVVRHLLAFSRRQVLEPVRVDLNGLVRRLFRLLERVLGPTVRGDLDLGDDVPSVRVDVGQIEQVVMNLVINARDAMPEGGRLTITTAPAELDAEAARLLDLAPGSYVSLAVEDTGIGMDEATRMRIFEPFFTTKGDRGTGLGLSSVYGIVRQSGGQVAVESHLGHGTRFEIWLPADAGAGSAARRGDIRESGEVSHALPPARLLLVEDQKALRNMIQRALRGLDLEIQSAGDAEAALELLEGGPPDLLISDVAMPGMSGPELAQRARALAPRLPVLFVTGYWPHEVPTDSAEDPTFLLLKPFTPKRLRALVQEILRKYHSPSSE